MILAASSVLATTGLLTVATSGAFAADTVKAVSGSAYGASVDVKLLGLVDVKADPVPLVTLPAAGGGPFSKSLLSVKVDKLLALDVLGVSTEGSLGTDGSAKSSATVAHAVVGNPLSPSTPVLSGNTLSSILGIINLNLGGGSGGGSVLANTPLLTADVIKSQCTSDVNGSRGSSEILNLTLLGKAITVTAATAPNTKLDLPLIGTVFLNEQSGDKKSITVNAVRVHLDGILGKGDVIISQSHCDVTIGGGDDIKAGPKVFVGYAENVSENFLPTPWSGSPDTLFVGHGFKKRGAKCSPRCYDAGGVRVDNTTGSPITVHVSVDVGSHHYDLWGTQTVPAGKKLILTQTKKDNFDTSDTQPDGCDNATDEVPVVSVTVNGVTKKYLDEDQVLNTGGADHCGPEGHDWAELTS